MRSLPRRSLSALVAVGLVATACGSTDAPSADVVADVEAVTAAPPVSDESTDTGGAGDAATPDELVADATGDAATSAAAEEVATPPSAPASAAPVAGADALAAMREAGLAAASTSAARPVHLAIPAIGVDTHTIDLDLTAAEAEVPESFHVAGWYRQTRTPGTVGPAVIVGHVGSRNGPGVFDRLDQLRAGDEIHVTDADGTVRTFVVDGGDLVSKYDRPADVFGWVGDRPELRLITCGGEFDVTTGHHVSNYVIWAHLDEA